MLASGQSLNSRFTLLRPLGHGGLAEVWQVHDAESEQDMVAKIVEREADDSRCLLLQREGQMLRQLEHPNIVRFYGWHHGDTYDFLLMERVDGDDLGQLRGRPPHDILDAAIPIADALHHIHTRGIVHRDLKATNVRLDPSGSPRLLDFGIADRVGHSDLHGGGTRPHASPQQLAGAPASPADDLYAFGSLLLDLLAGGTLHHDLLAGDEKAAGAPQSNHPIPQRLLSLVDAMRQDSPADRPADAADVHRELRAIRDELETAEPSPRPDPLRADPPRLTPPPRRRDTPPLIVPSEVPSRRRPPTNTGRASGAMWLTVLLFAVLSVAALAVFLLLPDWVRQADTTATTQLATARVGALQTKVPAESLEAPSLAEAPASVEAPTAVEAATPSARSPTNEVATIDEASPAAANEAVPKPPPPSTAAPMTAERHGETQPATEQPPTQPPAATQPVAPPPPAPQRATPADDAAFTAAMTDGLSALEGKDFVTAREAFTRAANLRPGSPQSADGLARAELGLRLGAITERRRQAEASEADEAWAAAAQHYAAILELDSNIELAQAGYTRSRQRAELSGRLDHFIDHPDRLTAEAVLVDAATTLGKAREIPSPGPRLQQQIDQLGDQVEAFSTPVQARFESDNLTDVVVYKVGRLGLFDRHALALRPGTYTVVGSRRGYRDVRRQLVIAPGAEPKPLMIRCEEEI